MLKKTITFKDLDGNTLVEDFYFNLSKVEMTEMEFNQKGGLVERLQSIVATGDPKQILNTFKWILFKAYGVRSTDGKRFIKSPQLTEEFTQTDAYSILFMELVTNAEASGEFIRGIMPADLVTELDKVGEMKENIAEGIKKTTRPGARQVEVVHLPEPGNPAEKHPADMTREELIEAMRKKTEG